MQKYPLLACEDDSPDPASYEGFLSPFYQGALDAGAQVRLFHTRQLTGDPDSGELSDPLQAARLHPVLVVAGHYMCDDTMLGWLVAYAAAGGHLVLGPQTGYADHEARARTERQPARIASAAGVWFDEFSNLSQDLPVKSASGSELMLPAEAAGTRWVDSLQLSGAQELASYDHPHFGRWPAVTSAVHGLGRITYVGTIPNPALAQAIFAWLGPPASRPAWKNLPGSVVAASGVGRAGRRVHFLHNWSWTVTQAVAPSPLQDILTGAEYRAGDLVPLGSWDVRILAEP